MHPAEMDGTFTVWKMTGRLSVILLRWPSLMVKQVVKGVNCNAQDILAGSIDRRSDWRIVGHGGDSDPTAHAAGQKHRGADEAKSISVME